MIKRWAKAVYQQLDLVMARFDRHKLTDWAAALTYYSVLSIFPGLLALIAVLGLVGHGTSDAITDMLLDLPEGAGQDLLLGAVKHLEGQTGAATTALIFGLCFSIYSASRYTGAFIRAAGIILEVKETRHFLLTIPLRIGLTMILMVLAVLTAVAIVLTGPIMSQFTEMTGFDGSLIGGWGVIKWPLLLLLFLSALGVLYSLGPDFEDKRFRFATTGSVVAFLLWLVGSLLFSFFVANFGDYNKVYGSLAGVVIFLIWLYWSNIAVLLGLELDFELARFRHKYGYGAFSRQRFRREIAEEKAGATDEVSED